LHARRSSGGPSSSVATVVSGRANLPSLLRTGWAAVGGDPAGLDGLEVRRRGDVFCSPLAVEELLVAAVASALLAAAELSEVRSGRRPHIAVDVDAIAAAAASERHVRLDDQGLGAGFDPLSTFLEADDGWVRLHGNYPWHRRALLAGLGVDAPDEVAVAVARRSVAQVEDAVVQAGGCAAAVHTPHVWAAGGPGAAAAAHGLVRWSPGPISARSPLRPAPADRPAAGLRVVDLTRVIAGPVGTRMLAALGAEVVRIEDPARPELTLLALDAGLGKRWLPLDLATTGGRRRLEAELARADVVVAGHRPHALDRFGLAPEALAERHAQLVVVSLSAWGATGPWGSRRGFDSLVQAASGIAETVRRSAPDRPPGVLPVQALDHATGYFVAAAALRALSERERHGRADRAELALAATAHALMAAGPRPCHAQPDVDPTPHLVGVVHPRGRLRVVRPPGELDGERLRWPEEPGTGR
jgi:predicted nucleic acid-binding protein